MTDEHSNDLRNIKSDGSSNFSLSRGTSFRKRYSKIEFENGMELNYMRLRQLIDGLQYKIEHSDSLNQSQRANLNDVLNCTENLMCSLDIQYRAEVPIAILRQINNFIEKLKNLIQNSKSIELECKESKLSHYNVLSRTITRSSKLKSDKFQVLHSMSPISVNDRNHNSFKSFMKNECNIEVNSESEFED